MVPHKAPWPLVCRRGDQSAMVGIRELALAEDGMRNEIHDRACMSCGSTISRRRYSQSGLCLGCQAERRKIARKKVDHFAAENLLTPGMLCAILPSMSKNPNAVALGRLGGIARAKALKSRRRIEIARKAALARWGTRTPNPPLTHNGGPHACRAE